MFVFCSLPFPDLFFISKKITGVANFLGDFHGRGGELCYYNHYAVHKVWGNTYRKANQILFAEVRKAVLKVALSEAKERAA